MTKGGNQCVTDDGTHSQNVKRYRYFFRYQIFSISILLLFGFITHKARLVLSKQIPSLMGFLILILET